jgi:hypothetical protein
MQKSAVFRPLGSSSPVHKARGDELKGDPKKGSGFRVQGSGFRVQGSGFRVQGSGFRVGVQSFRLLLTNKIQRAWSMLNSGVGMAAVDLLLLFMPLKSFFRHLLIPLNSFLIRLNSFLWQARVERDEKAPAGACTAQRARTACSPEGAHPHNRRSTGVPRS